MPIDVTRLGVRRSHHSAKEAIRTGTEFSHGDTSVGNIERAGAIPSEVERLDACCSPLEGPRQDIPTFSYKGNAVTTGRWTMLLAVLLLITAGFWSGTAQQASGQATSPPPHGRYQVTVAPGPSPAVVVLDTATGEVWLKYTNGQWTAFGTPVDGKP